MNGRQIAIGSLLLTGVGTVFAGIQLWPGGEQPVAAVPPAEAQPQTVTKTGTQDNCGSVSQNQGNVSVNCTHNVNISSAASDRPFQRYDGNVSADTIDDFARFIEGHNDKVVYLSLLVEPEEQSPRFRVYEDTLDGRQRIMITKLEPCEYGAGQCGGIEFVTNTREGGELYWTNGSWRLDGYFSIEPVQGLHQGFVSVGLRGISSAQARLSDPQAK